VLNEGVCTHLFEGIFSLWISQLVTSFLLFLVILLSSILYQHFVYAPISPAGKPAESVNNAMITDLGYPVAVGGGSGTDVVKGEEDHIALMAVIDPGKQLDGAAAASASPMVVEEMGEHHHEGHDANEAAVRAENAAKAAFENKEGVLL
jgi:hypothetical protein